MSSSESIVSLFKRQDLNFGDKLIFLILRARLARKFKDILEYTFDMCHGTNTAGVISVAELVTSSKRKELASCYASTPGYEFRKILAHLDIDYRNYTFVDFGCGKGKVLFYAYDYGFQRVIGVEFCDLADIAKANMLKYDKRDCSRVIKGDAVDFVIPAEPCVLYFANPFSDLVSKEVLANIFAAYNRGNKAIYIIWYNTNGSAQPFLDAGWLEIVAGTDTTTPWIYPRTIPQVFEFCLPYTIFKVR